MIVLFSVVLFTSMSWLIQPQAVIHTITQPGNLVRTIETANNLAVILSQNNTGSQDQKGQHVKN